MNKRDSFVFYRAWLEAIETLSKNNRLLAYDAVSKYSLNGETPEGLPTPVWAIFRLAVPNIDANNRKYLLKLKKEAQQAETTEAKTENTETVKLPGK